MRSTSISKSKSCLKSTREKSRNGITSGKSTTIISSNKSNPRPITPVKLTTVHKVPSLNIREKALAKQNEDLKKQNSELLQSLKRNKDIIKEKIVKYKSENTIMKKFTETAWPWVEPRLDEELKASIKPLITAIKDTSKMNTESTNHTDHVSTEKSHSNRGEIELLKQRIQNKKLEADNLEEKLKETLRENTIISEYLKYLETKPTNINELFEDPSNIINDNDEEILNNSQTSDKVAHGVYRALPGFIRTLTLIKN